MVGVDLDTKGIPDDAVAVHADVSREVDVTQFVQTAEDHLGGVDLLFNNARVPATKAALAARGLCTQNVNPPLGPFSDDESTRIEQILGDWEQRTGRSITVPHTPLGVRG